MQTIDPSEQFFELMDLYGDFIEPLENWDTDDLISLQMVISTELQERDRIAQNEYFDRLGYAEDERQPRYWGVDDSYGGTE